MKTRSTFCGLCLMLTAMMAKADPVLVIGTPGNSQLSTPSKPTPNLGGTFLNFDSLTPFTNYSSYTASGVSITSPDGLLVYPYSTQSGPNELYDNSSDGSANLTISLANGSSGIGVGIADSDPVVLSIQALGAGGADLGPDFLVNLAMTESSVNTGNGYYVIQDTTADIFGLQITESVGDPNFSGLAIDDVQVAPTPEPSGMMLLATGLLGLVGYQSFRRFKRA